MKRFYGAPGLYASFACCGSETTAKFCRERSQSPQEAREQHTHGVDWGDYLANEKTMSPGQARRFREWRPPRRGGHSACAPVSLQAIRLKKSRLVKTAKTMVALRGNRVRFVTITCRKNVKGKKEFLYLVENIRKKLAKIGIEIKYSGMLERQKRGAWHLHCLAYTLSHEWDYKAIQGVAVPMGFNFDFRELGKARRASKKISKYISKLEAVCAAAYQAKQQTGEDYCYTLTSKGCDLPRHMRLEARAAWEFIQGKGFAKKDFRGFIYYLTENGRFSKDFYLNGFRDTR